MKTSETALPIVDIDDFLPLAEAEIELVGPGGKKTGWMVTLAGPGHPKREAASNEAARKALLRSKEIT